MQIFFTFSPLKEADLFEKTTPLITVFFSKTYTYLYLNTPFKIHRVKNIQNKKSLLSYLSPKYLTSCLEPTNIINFLCILSELFYEFIFPTRAQIVEFYTHCSVPCFSLNNRSSNLFHISP